MPIHWLWRGRIPLKCLTILEGDPGTSKSTLTCLMAAHVSKGLAWPDRESCPKGESILCNAEDPEDAVIVPRLMCAEADLTKVSIILPDDRQTFTIPDHVEPLRLMIKDKGVKFICFDPLEAFLSGSVDNRSNQRIRRAFRGLEMLAQEENCSIMVVRHLNKDAGKSAKYRGGGSIGIIAAARSASLVSEDPAEKGHFLFAPNKGNWSALKETLCYRVESVDFGGGIFSSKIIWTGEKALSANDILRPQVELSEGVDVADAADFIKRELKNGPRWSDDVFKAGEKEGLNRKTVHRATKLLGVIKTVDEGKWKWELEADVDSEFLKGSV